MRRLRRPRRRYTRAQEFDRALSRTVTEPVDPHLAAHLAVARAFAPSVHPREEWASALRARVLKEAAGIATVAAATGTHDGTAQERYTVRHTDPTLGEITITDVENIPDEKVHEVIFALARLRARRT